MRIAGLGGHDFRGKLVSELTAATLTEIFKRGQVSESPTITVEDFPIGSFLKYCLQVKDWIAVNPIERVPHYRGIGHRRGSAPALTAQQCAEIHCNGPRNTMTGP